MSLTKAERHQLRTSTEQKVLARIQAALPQMVARTAATRRLADGPWSSPTMSIPENPPQLTPDEQGTYSARKDATVLVTRRGFRLLTHPGESFSRVYRDDVPEHPIGIVWVSRRFQAGSLLVSAEPDRQVWDRPDPFDEALTTATLPGDHPLRGNSLAETPREALRYAARTHQALLDKAYRNALAREEQNRRTIRDQEDVAAAEDSLGLSADRTRGKGRA